MRINRQKRFNKYLSFYCNNFGFRKPFQIVIDGTFCQEALKSKVNISDQLPKYFQGEVKLITTKCVILETEKLGPPAYGAMRIVKQFPVHQCSHSEKSVNGAECLAEMVGEDNPKRYILATQDRGLQHRIRAVPGAPILFLYHKAPTLEEPSYASVSHAKHKIQASSSLSESEAKRLEELKLAMLGPPKPFIPRKKKKKGGPNPLSCKKKKKAPHPPKKKAENNKGSS